MDGDDAQTAGVRGSLIAVRWETAGAKVKGINAMKEEFLDSDDG